MHKGPRGFNEPGNCTLRGDPPEGPSESQRFRPHLFGMALGLRHTLSPPHPRPHPHPRVVGAQGFEIMSETDWYPRGSNTKPNRTSSVESVPTSVPSVISTAPIWAGQAGMVTPTLPRGDSSQRGQMPCPRSHRPFNATVALVTDSAPAAGTLCILHFIKFHSHLERQKFTSAFYQWGTIWPRSHSGSAADPDSRRNHLTARAGSEDRGAWQKGRCCPPG